MNHINKKQMFEIFPSVNKVYLDTNYLKDNG